MKSSIFVSLVVCLARFCDGLAIKCLPGVTDPSCTEERKEFTIPEPNQSQSESATEAQCLAGSEWESNCHRCRCSYAGRAECLKQSNDCDKGGFAKPALCKTNTTFQRDCNTCICLENGLALKFCRRSDIFVSAPNKQIASINSELDDKDAQKSAKIYVVIPNVREIKKTCRPNEVFELDCNMCWCHPDGQSYACTRKACAEQLEDTKKNATLSRKVRAFPTESPKACQPGKEFRLDCNKCLCDNKDQDISCTRNDCNVLNNNHHASAFTGARSKRDTSEQVSVHCVPGSVFDRDCNVCRCTESGLFATCTINRCNDVKAESEKAHESDQGFRCNAGEQFRDATVTTAPALQTRRASSAHCVCASKP